jgi:O-antigen/teichoic acid export membrane protein
MRTAIFQWIKVNSAIFVNAGSLVGAWGITSVLGFVYWWLAARKFLPQEVGIGSAAISTMTLLGTICLMGLGTLLITELPRQPEQSGGLISTALIVVSMVGGSAGLLFAVIAPSLSASFQPLRENIITVVLFAVGVSLTSVTLILDQAMIALLLGGVQMWRNTLFAVGKLALLFLIGYWPLHTGGMGIYGAWVAGNFLSLLGFANCIKMKKRWQYRDCFPQWSLLRKLGIAALQHHLLNLTLSVPTLVLPVIVTVLLSAKANAWFYVSWMIASIVFMVPGALTMVLHAMNTAQQEALQRRARVTLSLSFVISLLAISIVILGAKPVLSLFGSSYAQEAAWTLQILTLGVIPLVIKNHYISICRIHDRLTQALVGMAPGGLLELGAAVLGAYLGGLIGLSVAWVLAMFVESIPMFPTLHRTIFSTSLTGQSSSAEGEAVWLMDTALLPVLGQIPERANPIWLMDTALLPVLGHPSEGIEPVWQVDTMLLPTIKRPVSRKEAPQ